MSSHSEVRRVRQAMSASVGHDVHKLIALMNQHREQVKDRIVAPAKEHRRKSSDAKKKVDEE